jgi:hypothetical protein
MRPLGLLLLSASLWPVSLAAQVISRPRVDHAALADLIVTRAWQLGKGERVVIFWDPADDRGVAAPLRAAIQKAGAEYRELVPPPAAEFKAMPEAERDALKAEWEALFQGADAAIWLPLNRPVEGRLFERLVEQSSVRSIHYHWFLPPDAAEADSVERMYAAAIAVPPEQLLGRIAAIERAVRGATIRVTAPNGTDLTFEIPANAWVHRNTGDASRAKVRDARSVRDREEELPASLFRTTDLRNVRGALVGYSSFSTRSPAIRAIFVGGKVGRLEGLQGQPEVVLRWEAATGEKALPAEFTISTNPALPAVLRSGFMPYYGYGAGVVRLAIGDNWESGGPNRSSNGEVLFFLLNATVTANGVEIVKDGQLQPGF